MRDELDMYPGGARAEGTWVCDGRPWTFGAHHEGDGLLALYFAPAEASDLVPVFTRLGLDPIVELTPKWGVCTARRISTDEIATRIGPLELLHLPDQIRPSDVAILAAPDQALPAGSPRRFAFSLSEDGHGVFYTRERELLIEALRSFLYARVADHAVGQPASGVPILPEQMLEQLTEDLPEDNWREARIALTRHRWVLSVATVDGGCAKTTTLNETRWVLGSDRTSGWSW